MKKIQKFGFAIALVVFLFITTTPVQAQCPMCRANVEQARKTGKKVGNGLNSGILYLLAMPYLLAVGAGAVWYYNRKKKILIAD
jgi:hypothetical protein